MRYLNQGGDLYRNYKMMNGYCEEECENCDDGIIKIHKILSKEKKLQCLTCGHKQNYEELL